MYPLALLFRTSFVDHSEKLVRIMLVKSHLCLFNHLLQLILFELLHLSCVISIMFPELSNVIPSEEQSFEDSASGSSCKLEVMPFELHHTCARRGVGVGILTINM